MPPSAITGTLLSRASRMETCRAERVGAGMRGGGEHGRDEDRHRPARFRAASSAASCAVASCAAPHPVDRAAPWSPSAPQRLACPARITVWPSARARPAKAEEAAPRAFLEMIMPEHEARTRRQASQRALQPASLRLSLSSHSSGRGDWFARHGAIARDMEKAQTPLRRRRRISPDAARSVAANPRT